MGDPTVTEEFHPHALPFFQTSRTLCITPTPELKAFFNDLRQFGLAI